MRPLWRRFSFLFHIAPPWQSVKNCRRQRREYVCYVHLFSGRAPSQNGRIHFRNRRGCVTNASHVCPWYTYLTYKLHIARRNFMPAKGRKRSPFFTGRGVISAPYDTYGNAFPVALKRNYLSVLFFSEKKERKKEKRKTASTLLRGSLDNFSCSKVNGVFPRLKRSFFGGKKYFNDRQLHPLNTESENAWKLYTFVDRNKNR